MRDTVCTLCGQYGHRASQCPHNRPDAPIARAHFAADSAFGDAYQSQLAPLYGSPDKRGQHMAGNSKPVSIKDTSKFAPKHPKRGAQILLPGSRDQQHGVPTFINRRPSK